MTGVPVQVVDAALEGDRGARWQEFRAANPGRYRNDFELAEYAARGTGLLFWDEPSKGAPLGAFHWLCLGCGSWLYGQIGEQPVSGWEQPRWVNSGTPEKPTLTPSLGCGGWRRGTCPEGHYWLRNGILERA